MKNKLLLLFASLCPALVMAQGCDVQTRSQSASVPAVESHTCYQYEGMPANAIDWSCGNESKEMLSTTKKKVEQCADAYQATCTAKLTQEALANPHSTRKEENGPSINIPDAAQITTRYYDAADLSQARIDCESGGGRWETR